MVRAMKLYGSPTSPFVRRVRIVALELGIPFEVVSTATSEGEAELRRHTPLWKIPTAVFDEGSGDARVIWDSRAIIDDLFARHGYGPFRPPDAKAPWVESNRIHAIDGALEAAINVFYLEREGIAAQAAPYLGKQVQRIASVMHWVESQLQEDGTFGGDKRVGLAELALQTTLDWMVFRKRYPVADHPRLLKFQQAHADRPGFRQTYPAI